MMNKNAISFEYKDIDEIVSKYYKSLESGNDELITNAFAEALKEINEKQRQCSLSLEKSISRFGLV